MFLTEVGTTEYGYAAHRPQISVIIAVAGAYTPPSLTSTMRDNLNTWDQCLDKDDYCVIKALNFPNLMATIINKSFQCEWIRVSIDEKLDDLNRKLSVLNFS